jgi:hypothetical protein
LGFKVVLSFDFMYGNFEWNDLFVSWQPPMNEEHSLPRITTSDSNGLLNSLGRYSQVPRYRMSEPLGTIV